MELRRIYDSGIISVKPKEEPLPVKEAPSGNYSEGRFVPHQHAWALVSVIVHLCRLFSGSGSDLHNFVGNTIAFTSSMWALRTKR